MFVNGKPAAEMSREDDIIGAVDGDVLSLARYLNWNPDFDGLIGGVMIFDEAVSAERIARLYEKRPDDALTPQHRLVVTPRRYHRGKELGAELQLQPRGSVPSGLSVRVELLDANGKAFGGGAALAPDLRGYGKFAMPGESGTYTMKAVVRSGKEVIAKTALPIEVDAALQGVEPSWIGSKAGINRDVPPPWTSLKIRQKRKVVVVEPWGRQYEFANDSLISGIYVGEHNLLAAPVRMKMLTGKGEVKQGRTSLSVLESSDDRVRLSRKIGGRHPVEVEVRVEYDGMIWFDWKVSGSRAPITELTLEVPIAAEHARYLWHGGPGKGGGYEGRKPGFLPKEGFSNPFMAALWLGDEDRGLQWFADSDESWQLTDPSRAIEMVSEWSCACISLTVLKALVSPSPEGSDFRRLL